MKVQEYNNDSGTYFFYCPGCTEYHSLHTGRPNHDGVRLVYNHDPEFPSFHPDIIGRQINAGLNRSKHGNDLAWRCWYGIKYGKVTFAANCSHELAGQTVDVPELMPPF